MRIFISHATPDAALAHALRDLYANAFDKTKVQVRYSSDQSPGGGIPPGKPWLQWIEEEVKCADRTVVLLTRQSLRRPWLLWESGAATGAALVSVASKVVVPMLFRVTPEQLPPPLQSLQVLRGDDASGVRRELDHVNAALDNLYSLPVLGAIATQYIPLYLSAVNASLALSHPDDSEECRQRDAAIALAIEAFIDKLTLQFRTVSLTGFGTLPPFLAEEEGRPHTNAFGVVVSYDAHKSGADALAELKALVEKIARLRAQREIENVEVLLNLFMEVQGRADPLVRELRKIRFGTSTLAEPWGQAQEWLLGLWRELSHDFCSFQTHELEHLRAFLERHPAYSVVYAQDKVGIDSILHPGKTNIDELLALTSDALPKFLKKALDQVEAA